jgi:hypothetical protein
MIYQCPRQTINAPEDYHSYATKWTKQLELPWSRRLGDALLAPSSVS